MSDGAIFLGLAGLVLGLAAVAIYAAIKDDARWQKFAADHECQVVGEVWPTSTVGVGVGTNGQVSIVPITVPGKTGYACNDGITYWR